MKKITQFLIIITILLINFTVVFAQQTVVFTNTDATDEIPFLIEEQKLDSETIQNLVDIKKLAVTDNVELYKEKEEEKNKRNFSFSTPVSATDSELDMLAKIIYAEARGECYDGKVAVGAVVLNRVKSSKYPNTIKQVIFAPRQFSPINDGSYYSAKPTEQEYNAAKDALSGIDPTYGALTFYAYKYTSSKYHESMTHTATIGNHKFFK